MGSYIISVAWDSGVYRHLRIGQDATLLALHEAIVSAWKLGMVKQPSFSPQKQPKGKPPVKYSTNRTKTTLPMREIALKDTGFATGNTLVYRLASPQMQFNCRMIKVLEEDTSEPLVIRASGEIIGAGFDWDSAGDIAALKGMMEIIALPEECWPAIIQYFCSAANLYGVVPMGLVHELYCRDEPQISRHAFSLLGLALSYAKNSRFSILDKRGRLLGKEDYNALSEDYVVDYSLLIDDAFEQVRSAQQGKPWYLPAREELLRYDDDDYVEKSIYYNRLASHLLASGMPREDLEDFMLDISRDIRDMGADSDLFMDLLNDYGASPKNLKEANKLLQLYADLNNNTRMHENCGHTPSEMRAFQGKTNMAFGGNNPPPPFATPAPEGQLIPFPGPSVPVRKPGRNEPCPCGSGKKHKHCCGKPGE